MVCSKIKKILFILFCCFVVILPFWCVAGFCDENVEVISVSNLSVSSSRNYFANSGQNLGYFHMEQGYVYHIHFGGSATVTRKLAVSSEVPKLNGVYTFLGELSNGDTFDYIPYGNDYLYFSYFQLNDDVVVTRDRLQDMTGAVSGLVENVGPNSIWSVFDISIDYIYIVVFVALGIFIIFIAIRKLSKGKEGF